MKAAGLKAIDTVVSSTAILVKSKNPSNPAMVDLITSRIKGVIGKSPSSPSPFFHPPQSPLPHYPFSKYPYLTPSQPPKNTSSANTTSRATTSPALS
jgi:hypothetical protein